MQRVKLRSLYASPEQIARAGDVIDVPDEVAKNLVAGNYAEIVEEESPELPRPPEPASEPEQAEPADDDSEVVDKPKQRRGPQAKK